jgi:2-keto-4-pentenoate hydratase
MSTNAQIRAVAERRFAEHRDREKYSPLGSMMLDSLDEGYRAMEKLLMLWKGRGPVGGYKIALTSKPIQELCGVNQPCGGFVFRETIHPSAVELSLGDFNGLALEFELAVRLGKSIPAASAPFTAGSIREYVAACHPAFELIDDRRADYNTLDAISMLSDNIWCGGVVLGPEVADWQGFDLAATPVHLTWNGERVEESSTGAAMGNPMESLAWLANLAAERDWPMREGMIIITGSTLATKVPKPGDNAIYTVEGMGDVEVSIRA